MEKLKRLLSVITTMIILSATFTVVSSTKTLHKRRVTLSTLVGMLRDQYTVSYLLSPIFEKLAAVSTVVRVAYEAGFATSFIGKSLTQSCRGIWSILQRNGYSYEGGTSEVSPAVPARSLPEDDFKTYVRTRLSGHCTLFILERWERLPK